MKLLKSLYFWIIIAFMSGSMLGIFYPTLAVLMEPLGANFIKLIKLFIGPIIFLTIATGIAQTGSLKKFGKISLKAFIYFEVVSSIALLIGWLAAYLIQPGSLIQTDLNQLDKQAAAHLIESVEKLSFIEFIQHLIPTNLIDPFIKGDLLQILVIAILFGTSLLLIGNKRSKNLIDVMDQTTQALFQIIRIIMYVAPLGVFGSIAYTIGKFGGGFLISLLALISTFYLTGFLFVFVILGLIAKAAGFSLLRFLKYMLPELFLVLGTSSSESALPQLLNKLKKLGCKQETVGVVVPMGYSFNLDGTSIYLTLASLFIAQALGIHLTLTQQLLLFATGLLSSKGAAGVSGSGLIMLAATLSIVPTIPTVGIVLIMGIDRFMSEARSMINFIGNGVASLIISRCENEVSAQALNQAMNSIHDEGIDQPSQENLIYMKEEIKQPHTG